MNLRENCHYRPVIATNIITGDTIGFKSIKFAVESKHSFEQSSISKCCSGKQQAHKGHTWKCV